MAYSTQIHFLKIKFPHEMSTHLPSNTGFTTKSYGSCTDVRSWSLNKAERAQYYLELLSAKEPAGKPAAAIQVACPKDRSEEYKKQIKELQERIASLACQLECNQCCKAEMERLQDLYDIKNCEIAQLECEIKAEVEETACLVEENKTLREDYCEACTTVKELQEKYDELQCQLETELNNLKCKDTEISRLLDENAELSLDINESCKKIEALNQQICSKEREDRHNQHETCCQQKQLNKMNTMLRAFKEKLEKVQCENCNLQKQLTTNNDYIQVAQAEIDQLTKENGELCQQLKCLSAPPRESEPDAENEFDQKEDEDYETIKLERDCYKCKFMEMKPDLEELACVVEDFTDLEDRYNEMSDELEEYKAREAELVDQLQTLMGMEVEFKKLQKRVSESERLLTEYQVLKKLECLRSGYTEQNDYLEGTTPTTAYSDTSDAYEADDVYEAEQIPSLEMQITCESKPQKKRKKCPPKNRNGRY